MCEFIHKLRNKIFVFIIVLSTVLSNNIITWYSVSFISTQKYYTKSAQLSEYTLKNIREQVKK